MKNFILGLSVALLLTSTVFGQEKQIRFYKNFEKAETVSPVIEKDGIVYISIRDIVDLPKSEIEWYDNTKTAYYSSYGFYITAGNREIKAPHNVYVMSAPAEIINNRLMIPIDGTVYFQIFTNDNLYHYDSENAVLNYILPKYYFSNGLSDYYFSTVAVDFTNCGIEELQNKIIALSKHYEVYSDKDTIVIESMEEYSEGSGEIIFAVKGEHNRKIKAEIIGGYAVYIYDEAEVVHRDVCY